MEREYNFKSSQILLNDIRKEENGYSFYGFSVVFKKGGGYSFPEGKINQEFVDENSKLNEEEILELFFENLAQSYEAREKKDLETLNSCYKKLTLKEVKKI